MPDEQRLRKLREEEADAIGVPAELHPVIESEPLPVQVQLYRKLRERRAEELLHEIELAEARGTRVVRTADQFAALPQPVAVIDDVLAAEVNLLGGPQAAGKSLLARDWALSVATGEPWHGHAPPEVRNVLWVASEGLKHDFRERWVSQPLYSRAKRRLHFLDDPVDLVSAADVDWLLKECADQWPGLVVFDVIYGMGLSDDNGVKDVLPVLSSMKRLSKEWDCATLALGHPPHNSQERRFRGSSMWKQLAYTDWFLGGGRLTCEKSKLTNAAQLGLQCRLAYPQLVLARPGDTVDTRRAVLEMRILRDLDEHPLEAATARARRMIDEGGIDVTPEYLRKEIGRIQRLREADEH